MINKTIAILALLICIFSASSIVENQFISANAKKHDDSIKNHKHNPHSCIGEQQLHVIPRSKDYQQSRLLQTQETHGFKIYGSFPSGDTAAAISDWSLIDRTFKIASKYFQTLLLVTKLTNGQTLYSTGSTCGSTTISQQMKTNGFDPDAHDCYIFIQGVNDNSLSYSAQAAPCLLTRWVVYGFIKFNYAHMQQDLKNIGGFHNGILTAIHQLTHIFALNPTLFQYYYTSYNSNVDLGQSNVITTRPGHSTTYMVISPNVKSYISTYFSCADTSVGAVLQDEGGDGTANAHWDRKVFYNQLMTGSVWPSGLKITPLTLNLFKDTGFYHTVDITLSDAPKFGKGLGCDFAKGNIHPSRQFCTGSSNACGYEYNYIGKCDATDPYANSASYVKAYSSSICNNPDLQGENHNVYDPFSRCFAIQTGQHYCFKAECTVNGIEIKIEDSVVICGTGDTTISSPKGTLTCPDKNLFCSVKSCLNWCGTRGLCVNGNCINDTSLVDTVAESFNLNVSQQFIISISTTGGVILLFFIVICCVGRSNAKNKQQAEQKQQSRINDKSRQFIQAERIQQGQAY